MVSDLAISAQKYPKIVRQKMKNFKESATVFFKTTSFFTEFWHCFSHVKVDILDLPPTQHRAGKKTGEGNVLLDLAISAQKYPKIVTQEKEKCWHVAACLSLVSMLEIPTRTWGPFRLTRGAIPISFWSRLPSKIYQKIYFVINKSLADYNQNIL